MIRIVNMQGQQLELKAGQKVTVEKYNPLFNDADKLFQDYSYPIPVPMTENNKKFMEMGHLAESSNDVYIQVVRFYIDTFPISLGNLRYRVGLNGYEANLQPNLAAVKTLIETAYLTDIRTYDVDYTHQYNIGMAEFAAYMKDTCVNPDAHDLIYVPVKNTDYKSDANQPNAPQTYEFMNQFNRFTGVFNPTHPAGGYPGLRVWANVPFYKLVSILRTISDFLGFEAVGDVLSHPTYQNYLLWTCWSFGYGPKYPRMKLMPYKLIGDAFREIRERFHFGYDFNLDKGTLTFETFKSIKNKTNIVDLTPFLTDKIEWEIPEDQGYSVWLKSDEKDNMYLQDVDGTASYPPVYKLIAGNGKKEVELQVATLTGVTKPDTNIKYVEAKQKMVIDGQWYGNAPGSDWPVDTYDTFGSGNKWPLKVFNYLGYNLKSDGTYWPDSEPVDLNDDDMEYYRFLTDRKLGILYLKVPAAVLSQWSATDKYGFRTKDLNFIELIMDHTACDYDDSSDYIDVKFHAWTLGADIKTDVFIKPVKELAYPGEDFLQAFIKSYFDKSIHGFEEVALAVRRTSGPVIPIANITTPTSNKGLGGKPVLLPTVTGTGDIIFRVYTGQPISIEANGQVFPFVPVADYYEATIPQDDPTIAVFVFGMYDFLWIRY